MQDFIFAGLCFDRFFTRRLTGQDGTVLGAVNPAQSPHHLLLFRQRSIGDLAVGSRSAAIVMLQLWVANGKQDQGRRSCRGSGFVWSAIGFVSQRTVRVPHPRKMLVKSIGRSIPHLIEDAQGWYVEKGVVFQQISVSTRHQRLKWHFPQGACWN